MKKAWLIVSFGPRALLAFKSKISKICWKQALQTKIPRCCFITLGDLSNQDDSTDEEVEEGIEWLLLNRPQLSFAWGNNTITSCWMEVS
jgi:hypothetical protein